MTATRSADFRSKLEPGHPPSVFISFAEDDEVLAKEIADELSSSGADVFLPRLHYGMGWADEITADMRQANVVLVLVSRSWVDSPYSFAELSAALTARTVTQGNAILVAQIDSSRVPPVLSPFLTVDVSRAYTKASVIAKLVLSVDWEKIARRQVDYEKAIGRANEAVRLIRRNREGASENYRSILSRLLGNSADPALLAAAAATSALGLLTLIALVIGAMLGEPTWLKVSGLVVSGLAAGVVLTFAFTALLEMRRSSSRLTKFVTPRGKDSDRGGSFDED